MCKKALPFFLIFLICIALSACGEGGGNAVGTTAATTTAVPQTTAIAAVTTTAPIATVPVTTTTAPITTPPAVTTTASPPEAVKPEALLDAANTALLAEDEPYRATISGRFLSNNFFYAPFLSGIRLDGEQYVAGADASLFLSFVEIESEIATIGDIAYATYQKDGVTERYRATVDEAQKNTLIEGIALPPMKLTAFSDVTAATTREGTVLSCKKASRTVIDAIGRALAYAEPHMPEGITLSVTDVRLSILLLPDGRYASITVMADCTANIHGYPLPTILKISYLLDYDGGRAPSLPEDIASYEEVDYDELLGGLIPDEE